MAERRLRGRLVFGARVLPGELRLERGRIAEVRLDESGSPGPYVAPGLVDIHIHGSGGFDAMAGPEALDGMATFLLRHGVTSFLPTSVAAPLERLECFAADVRGWLRTPTRRGAEALGFNFEGPFLSAEKKGAQSPEHLIDPAQVPWSRLEPLLPGMRVMTVAPELPGALELIRRLTAAGVAVALGHSNATAAEARAGYAAGAVGTTHLFNAMSPVHQHSPGLAAEALADGDAAVELVADGYHVDRALWPVIWSAKREGKVILVTDAISLAGAGTGRLRLGELEVEVTAERSTLAGTDILAGSVISLDVALRNVVRAGASLPSAVAAATRNPLALAGVRDRGRLAPGQLADLVLLDEDLKVERVIQRGEEVV